MLSARAEHMQPVNLRILARPRPGSREVTKVDALPNAGGVEVPAKEAELLKGPVRRVCLVCKTKASAYTCPRCSIAYCSSACYKSHSERCTEGFYRRHVEAELRVRDAERRGSEEGAKDRKAVVRALQKWRGSSEASAGEEWLEEGGGNAEEDELARLEVLARLGEEGALGLDQLTEEERNRFLADVASGDLGKQIEVWKPWWEVPVGAESQGALVEEVGSGQPDQPGIGARRASVTLGSLSAQVKRFDPSTVPRGRVPPSPSLRFHVLDVLFSYAYVARVYNGCWADEPLQACEELLALSASLSSATCRVQSAAEVLTASVEAMQRLGGAAGAAASAVALGVANDGMAIVSNRTRVLCAIADAFNIARAAADEVKPADGVDSDFELDALTSQVQGLSVKEGPQPSNDPAAPARGQKSNKARVKQLSKLLKVLHKLRFFLAWAKEQQESGAEQDVFSAMAEELGQELAVLQQQRSDAEERRHLVSQPVPQVFSSSSTTTCSEAEKGAARPRKPLIEEISH